jgi:hypothetical protein
MNGGQMDRCSARQEVAVGGRGEWADRWMDGLDGWVGWGGVGG